MRLSLTPQARAELTPRGLGNFLVPNQPLVSGEASGVPILSPVIICSDSVTWHGDEQNSGFFEMSALVSL